MTYSLNEAEATARKAARGAGYGWGLAEEAGKAVRWLCMQSEDSVAVLAGLLERIDGETLAEHTPTSGAGTIQAEGAWLCPLLAGVMLSDSAAQLRSREIRMEIVLEPMFLLPFAARAALQLEMTVTVSTPAFSALTDGRILTLTGTRISVAEDVLVRAGGTVGKVSAHATRCLPNPEAWAVLSRFAERTYAPATEASRLLGAGAGVSEDD
ncbi:MULTISPECIES: DUF3726 domain-containing protein [Alphaproteobacteria]|uniref:DUF3726 domain-containing protein n=1 Tax=Alphaproteobacteria TaxID=28211 RepID=UPI003266D423